MGLRVRKIIKLAPGVKLNLSKSGGSFSFGGKGLTVNVGKKGRRTTVGLPGSGISYSAYQAHEEKGAAGKKKWLWTAVLIIAVLAVYVLRG